ncbi:hypothetical protein AGMMS49992_20360 [Clostridia bacterium]|nr:hypothetical protein AGMMS49992_20360 [Clostridia bacterium]
MTKRILSLAVAVCLALAVWMPGLAEESSRLGGLTLPLVDKPTTVSILATSNYTDFGNKLFFQELTRRTGITFDVQVYTQDVFAQKVSTIIASGDLPDIMTAGLTLSEINTYGEQGAFVNVADYLDELPNFRRIYYEDETNYNKFKSYTIGDGHAYVMPQYALNRDVNHGFMYRQDIFDKLGLTPWNSSETFYENLKALKAAYPDSYPYVGTSGVQIFSRWQYYWNMAPGAAYPFYYDEETQLWKNSASDPKMKEMLDFMQKLYAEGLIDPEILTDSLDALSAKLTTDKGFVFNNWIGRMTIFNTQMAQVNPEYNLVYGRPIAENKQFPLEKFSSWGVSIANKPNALTAMKLADYLYSDEGSELNTIGVEGVNFEWDENGNPVYPELEGKLVDIVALEENYGMWLQGLYLRSDHRSVYYSFTPNEQHAQDLINNEVGYFPEDPTFTLTESDQETFADLQLELQKELEVFESNYLVNASYGQKEWDEFVAKIDSQYTRPISAILNR